MHQKFTHTLTIIVLFLFATILCTENAFAQECEFTLEDIEICADDAPATVFGPSGYATYSWSNGATTQNISVSVSGVYTVNVVDMEGCEASASAVVTINQEPSISLEDVEVCTDDSPVTITAPQGFASYTWSTGASTQSIIVSTSGTYTVTVIDENGCDASASATVAINPAPSISLEDVEICANYSPAILSGPAGFSSYAWSNGATPQSITVSSSGVYTLTVTDANGCTASACAQVTVYPNPSISFEDIEVCEDNFPVLINGPSNFQNYSWSNGATEQNTLVDEPGVYTLTVYDENGCAATASVSISVENEINPDFNYYYTCQNTLEISSLFCNYPVNYEWQSDTESGSGVLNTPFELLSDISETSISLSLFNDSGENITKELMLETPTILFNIEDILTCENQFPIEVNGPDNMIAYEWNDGSTEQNIFIDSPGIYALSIIDENGCTAIDSFTVEILDIDNWEFEDIYTCGDFPIIETFQTPSEVNNTCQPYMLYNENGDLLSSFEHSYNTLALSFFDYGSYTLNTELNGCLFSATINVLPFEIESFFINDLQACENDFPIVADIPLLVIDEEPVYDVIITLIDESGSVLGTFISGDQSTSVEIPYYGNYQVFTNPNDCFISADFSVLPNEDISFDLENIQVCEHEFPITIEAPEGYLNYEWSTGEITPTGTFNEAGDYSVTVTAEDGCVFTENFNIGLYDNPEPIISSTNAGICPSNFPIELTLNESYTSYLWSNGDTNPTTFVNEAGTYTAIVSNDLGCLAEASIELGPDFETVYDCESIITVMSDMCTYPIAYEWSLNGGEASGFGISEDENFELNDIIPGIYTISLTDFDGQVVSKEIIIESNPAINLAGASVCESELPFVLTVTEGYETYNWHNSSNNSTSLNVFETGEYCITVSNYQNCSTTSCAYITVNENPDVQVPEYFVCPSDFPVEISVEEGYAGYLWSNGASGYSTSVEEAGIYSVIVTNVYDCTSEVIIDVSLEKHIETNYICDGNLEVITNLCFDPIAYSWELNNGEATGSGQVDTNTFIISELVPGYYDLTVSDPEGNEVNDYNILIMGHPEFTLDDITICSIESPATLYAPNGNYDYLWEGNNINDEETGISLSVDEDGEYCLTVTNVQGCSTTHCAFVTINPTPVNFIDDYTACPETLPLTVTTNEPFESYLWSTGETDPSIELDEPGIYSVEVVNEFGCSKEETFEFYPWMITYPCFGEILVQSNICNEPLTYSWVRNGTDSGTGTSDTDNFLIDDLEPGSYELTLSNSLGFSTTETNIIVPEPPEFNFEDITICQNESPITVSGPSGNYSYFWQSSNPNENDVYSKNNSLAFSGEITLTVYNENDCPISESFTLEYLPKPNIPLGDIDLCLDQFPYSLKAPDGFALYEWSTGETTQTVIIEEEGNITLTVWDEFGCFNSEFIELGTSIDHSHNCNGVLSISTFLCHPPLDYTLTANDGSFNFSGSSEYEQFTIQGVSPGFYTLNIVNTMGHEKTKNIIIQELPNIIFEIISLESTNAINNLPNGSVEIITDNGNFPLSYELNGEVSTSATQIFNDTIQIYNIPEGDYTLNIFDNSGDELEIDFIVMDEIVPRQICQGAADILILNDCSNSVDALEYIQSKAFYMDVLEEFNIGIDNDETRVSFVEWSDELDQDVIIPFTGDTLLLAEYVDTARSYLGATHPQAALAFGYDYLKNAARQGATKILLLSTDAFSNQLSPSLIAQAEEYKQEGFTIATVAFDHAYNSVAARNLLKDVASTDLLAPGAISYNNIDSDLAYRVANLFVCPFEAGNASLIYPQRDGAITIDSYSNAFLCPDINETIIDFTVHANKELSIPPGTAISFYYSNPVLNGSNRIYTFTLPCPIEAGDSESFSVHVSIAGPADIYAVFNDDGSIEPPFNFPITDLEESIFANNIDFISICNEETPSLSVLQTAITPESICGSIAMYKIDVCNLSEQTASNINLSISNPEGFEILNIAEDLNDCAVHETYYTIPSDCCVSLVIEYNVENAPIDVYTDEILNIDIPDNFSLINYTNELNNSIAVVDSVECRLMTELAFNVYTSATDQCENSMISYEYYIQNNSPLPLYNIQFEGNLSANTTWVYAPYNMENISISNNDIDGKNKAEFTIAYIPANSTASFNLDAYAYDWEMDGTLTHTANLSSLPEFLNLPETFSSFANDVTIRAIPDVIYEEYLLIEVGEIAELSVQINGATTYEWQTGGDGDFSSKSDLTTTYTPGVQDIEQGYVELSISGFSEYDECSQGLGIVRLYIASEAECNGEIILPDDYMVCHNDTIEIIPDFVFQNNEEFDIQYVLHNGNETDIIAPLHVFEDSYLYLPEGFESGQSYYLTAISSDESNGKMVADTCSLQSDGVPVEFLTPLNVLPSIVCLSDTSSVLLNLVMSGGYAETQENSFYTLSDYDGPIYIESGIMILEVADSTIVPITVTDYICSRSFELGPFFCNAVLSIDLAEFDGENRGTYNQLNWSVLSEQENEYFLLERSEDGIHFSELAKIPAGGTHSEQRAYSYTDGQLNSNEYYYRLKWVSYQGISESAKNIVYLQQERSAEISVYPNPVTDILNIDFNAESASVKLYNYLGQVIYNAEDITSVHQLDTSDFPSGIYFIELNIKGKSYIQKLLKE